ncbi:MAG: PhoP regulatory network YrbL family protein [Puniceicoccales bacterium]|jgi:hypothetical protein|nr:PhoP regulatory network YrbL family protein [Puniceicoccales bacterium]
MEKQGNSAPESQHVNYAAPTDSASGKQAPLGIFPAKKLELERLKPVAMGAHNFVFIHPDDPSLVVKVIKPAMRYENQKKLPLRRRLFRRFKHHKDFLRTVTEHIASYVKAGPRPSFLQRFYCLIETDYGLASVTKAERDKEGNFAPTLRRLLRDGKFDDKAQAALENFFEEFLKSDVIISDIHNIDNLVYSYDEEKDTSRFIVIDGLGESTLLPFCAYFKIFNRLQKLRKIKKMRKAIATTLATKPDTERS